MSDKKRAIESIDKAAAFALNDPFWYEYCEDNFEYYEDNFVNKKELTEEEINKIADEWLKNTEDEMDYDVILDTVSLSLLDVKDKETLIKILNRYFEAAKEKYMYYENEYSGYGDNDYLYSISSSFMYVCGRYFDSINEKEKADLSYLIALGNECNAVHLVENYHVLECFEDVFDRIKDYLYADWLAYCPRIAWAIGKYYLEKENYEKASDFFAIGADINYDGRQSAEPFIRVGENEYELGMLYLNGKGVEENYNNAFELFDRAACDAGEEYIPAMGDMYFEGKGVENNFHLAIDCYASYNKYLGDRYVYYMELDDNQKEILEKYADKKVNKKLSYKEYNHLADIYLYRLHDDIKYGKVCDKKREMVLSTPLEKRDNFMDQDYVKTTFIDLKNKLRKPKENTGSIPEKLEKGDVFTFGKFNGEPLTWKVLEENKDGSYFVISEKIIAKMMFDDASFWLNNDFYKYSFTKEEKTYIKNNGPTNFYGSGMTYIYLLSESQYEKLEGTYPEGTIKQTDFAASLSKNNKVFTNSGEMIMPDGRTSRLIDTTEVAGIRPAMDVFIKPVK